MIKVYVTGFNKPYAITGELVSEDEQYLVVTENGVNKRISQDRVVYVEEFDAPAQQAPTPAPQPRRPTPPRSPPAAQQRVAPQPQQARPEGNPMKEALEKAIKERKAMQREQGPAVPLPPDRPSQIEPEELPLPYDPEDTMIVEVNFSGAKQGAFDISVPKGVMTGRYTPALGREIFSHVEIKNVLTDGTAILDGIPAIKGNKVFYTTKPVKATEQTPQERMQMVGQLLGAGGQMMGFQNLVNAGPKPSNVSPLPKTEFSMPASPFQTVPTLTVDEGDD